MCVSLSFTWEGGGVGVGGRGVYFHKCDHVWVHICAYMYIYIYVTCTGMSYVFGRNRLSG